jgi:hypothetical protein
MINQSIVRRLLLGAATGLALAVAGVSVPIVAGALTPAMAQSSEDMAAALDAYGHWVRLAPYGEVWVPDGVPSGWRPYEYGHWVYTDDWGWYWVSDAAEDDWGWVVYHYGRWVHDRRAWFWVPGDDWAPAWVDWRYGDDNVGWAPLPPDNLIDTYDEQPDYWVFVPLRYIGEPGLRSHFVPLGRRAAMLRETRVINRPVHIEGRRVWVNPGLAPGFIAGRTHVTLHAYNVRPRVFGANSGVQGAVTVRAQDLHTKGAIRRVAPVTVQRTNTVIQATTSPVAPKPLGKGERGQLGSHPPRAAQGTVTPQPQQPQGPIGAPPRTGAPVIQHPGSPAPVIAPAAPAQVQPQKKLEEPRVVNPPMGGARAPAGGPPPQPQVVHPAAPTPPPPAVHAPPPPVVHAPPPPVVHAPPPVVHAPPPPVVHAPPPPAMRAPPPAAGRAPPPAAGRAPPPAAGRAPAPKPGEKQPEPPK